MYYDKAFNSSMRYRWSVGVRGSELAPKAKELFHKYATLETKERRRMSQLMLDPTIQHDSNVVVSCKQAISEYGKLREACAVWAHEFARTPDRVFKLTESDLRFFGFASEQSSSPDASNRSDWKYKYTAVELLHYAERKLNRVGKSDDKRLDAIVELIRLATDTDDEFSLSMGDVVYFDIPELYPV